MFSVLRIFIVIRRGLCYNKKIKGRIIALCSEGRWPAMGIFKSDKKQTVRPGVSAVIVAAGSARRMLGVDKISAELGGSPVILRSISAFECSPCIKEIIVVTREELIPLLGRLAADYGLKKLKCAVKGGESRAESVYRGLMHISRTAEFVAVHDGARPLVSPELIERTAALAAETGAAIPALPVKDTLKRVQNGVVTETPRRAEFFAAQTPQIFRADVLKAALARALEEGADITDDASAVERLGMQVSLVDGEENNIKITTRADLILAEAILERGAFE